jgi:hypothetical protein
MSIKPNDSSNKISKSTLASNSDSERELGMLEWIADQVTILQTAFKEPMTEQQQEIYVRALSDISQEQLQAGFDRALRELTFFPKVAEIRKLAGSIPSEENKIEALAAWNHVNEYLRQWGVDRLPQRSGGTAIEAPPLDPRTEYALRRIGGFRALNWVLMKNLPFMQRDFCEAYELSGLAAHLSLPQFAREKLIGPEFKQLATQKAMVLPPAPRAPDPQREIAHRPSEYAPPAPEQLRERATLEKQRLEQWLAKRATAGGTP